MSSFYRVCKKETLQGLWYDYTGNFTGLIHNELNFCVNYQLKMDFDPELVGWLSATETLEDLFNWFSKEDIIVLQKHGWFIHVFETNDFKHYEKFNHTIIKQETSVLTKIIEL